MYYLVLILVAIENQNEKSQISLFSYSTNEKKHLKKYYLLYVNMENIDINDMIEKIKKLEEKQKKHNGYIRTYYQKHKNEEHFKEKQREYYEKYKEKKKEYYQNNREKILQNANKKSNEEYIEINRERLNLIKKEWREINKDKIKEYNAIYYLKTHIPLSKL